MPYVTVHPFSRQTDGSEVVIGLPEKGVFLALPPEAVSVLDSLATGMSIDEARAEHRRLHGEDADVEALVAALEPHGFVSSRDSAEAPNPGAPTGPSTAVAPAPTETSRFQFTGFPQDVARRIFSVPVGLVCLVVVILAAAVWLRQPALLPGWRSLVFEDHAISLLLLLMLTGFATTFLHEMAHVVAARSRGVDSRVGIGNRLWILVAETDLTGLWKIPRKQRYLPLLAGMAMDLVSAAALVLVLRIQGPLSLHPTLVEFLQALGMVYLLRIVWQTFFFVRTDLYYVYANYFGCKNLMGDTRHYLSNLWARTWKRPRPFDQSQIPQRETKAIRAYAGFWLVGRLLALVVLFTITLPVLGAYALQVGRDLVNGPGHDLYGFIESSVLAIASITLSLAGFVLWFRSLRHRSTPHA